jgi:hypothetical protein
MPASSPAAASGKPSAADCKIIKPIAASAVTKLTPLQTEPKAQAAATLKAYLGELAKAEVKLTSPAGKEVIGSYITTLEKTGSESQSQATAQMIAELGKLGSACP